MTNFTVITLKRLKSHSGNVSSMCISHKSGTVYASAGEDSMLKLWSIDQNEVIYSMKNTSPVTCCTFLPSENGILFGNRGGTVILFDLNSSKRLARWDAHSSQVNSVCFIPGNNSTFLSCGNDGKIALLEVTSNKPSQVLRAHEGPINFLSVRPDGRYFASAGDDMTVRIYDLNAFSQIASFKVHNKAVTCLLFHPTLPFLISGGADRVEHIFDVDKLEYKETNFPRHSSKITALSSLKLNDKCIISASDDSISIISLNPISQIERIPLQCGHVCDIMSIKNNILVTSYDKDYAILTRVKLNNAMFSNNAAPNPAPLHSQNPSDIYTVFRRDRNHYLSQLSQTNNEINRLSESASTKSLLEILRDSASSNENGVTLLTLLNTRKSILKLDHAIPIFEICSHRLSSHPELCVNMIHYLLSSFGKIVLATLKMASQNGVDIALEERRAKSQKFIEGFKSCQPSLRNISKSTSSAREVAGNLLEDWNILLR